ncbi:MAG: hypothetical protein AAGB97_04530 [Dehalococcoidia bacterium]|nr:hypothetical protein [Chloroflexota bacterium]
MPRREDEYWASSKGNLRYYYKHKRYYRADIGCQLCSYERFVTTREKREPKLLECRDCHQRSLFWNERFGFYECLNVACRRAFAKDEIE